MKQQNLQPLQQRLNVDPRTLPTCICNECGHDKFKMVYIMKRVSPLLSGETKNTYFPIEVFVCDKCGNLNDEFNPFKQIETTSEMPSNTGTGTPIEPGKIIL